MATSTRRLVELLEELQGFYVRGNQEDAQLWYRTLLPECIELQTRNLWPEDDAKVQRVFRVVSWMTSLNEPKPFIAEMPPWLVDWSLTSRKRIALMPRIRVVRQSPRDALKQEQSSNERDPVEWAVVGVLVSAASLLLALETKINARKSAETAAIGQRVAAGNRVRLGAIKVHIDEMRRFLNEIPELGSITLNPESSGIGRTSIVFQTAELEEDFNQRFERVLSLIQQINRKISEIDSLGIPLGDEDAGRFVRGPLTIAEAKAARVLNPKLGPHERLRKADELLAHYSTMLENLTNALGRG